MNRQRTALFFVLSLLAVFEMVTAAADDQAAVTTAKPDPTTSGVATYSAFGAIVTAVLANFF